MKWKKVPQQKTGGFLIAEIKASAICSEIFFGLLPVPFSFCCTYRFSYWSCQVLIIGATTGGVIFVPIIYSFKSSVNLLLFPVLPLPPVVVVDDVGNTNKICFYGHIASI